MDYSKATAAEILGHYLLGNHVTPLSMPCVSLPVGPRDIDQSMITTPLLSQCMAPQVETTTKIATAALARHLCREE
jgi:hypothetical protein